MTDPQLITLSVLGIVLLSLIFMKAGPDLILVGGLTLLIVAGVVPVEKAIAGFASKGLLTVAFLYVVAEGMRQTGAMNFLGQRWLGTPKVLPVHNRKSPSPLPLPVRS
ncbi:MAG: hypothetical protein R3C11_13945 [Planctomycetaceae bacterium]